MAMPRVRHVWVRPPHSATTMPGLVLEWRRLADGWHALVTWAEPRGRIVTDVLPASCLTPRPGAPTTGSAYG